MSVVEAFQTPPCHAHGQAEAFGEAFDLPHGRGRPARAPDQQERPLRARQQGGKLVERRRRRGAVDALITWHVGDRGAAPERVLGQRQHHRTGTPAGGHRVGSRHELGDPVGAVDLGHPLGHLAEHAAVVDLLECLALVEVITNLTDEQDHRCGVLKRRMHRDARIGRARAARDKANAGLAGQLAVGLRHVSGAAFLPADDRCDCVLMVVERVDARQIALARHQEHALRALDAQLFDQNLAAIPFAWRTHAWSPRLISISTNTHSPSWALITLCSTPAAR